jgi:hypothetical protein
MSLILMREAQPSLEGWQQGEKHAPTRVLLVAPSRLGCASHLRIRTYAGTG